MVNLFEKRKAKKLMQEVEQNVQNQISDEERAYYEKMRNHKAEMRRRMRRKLIPAIILYLIDAVMIYELLGPSTNSYDIPITAGIIIIETLLLYRFISSIYMPTSDMFIVTGLTDRENPESQIFLQKWLIPRKLIAQYNIDGSQYAVNTVEGMAYLCDDLEFDPDTGELNITFGYPNLDRWAFLTKQGTHENMKKILKKLMKKNTLYDSFMDITVPLKAQEIAEEKIRRITATTYAQDTDAKQLSEDINREMETTDEEIKNILKPLKNKKEETNQ